MLNLDLHHFEVMRQASFWQSNIMMFLDRCLINWPYSKCQEFATLVFFDLFKLDVCDLMLLHYMGRVVVGGFYYFFPKLQYVVQFVHF